MRRRPVQDWLATNPRGLPKPSVYVPPALHFPADAQDTELALACLPTFSVSPSTVTPPHVPFTWLITNALVLLTASSYTPPALQFPADAHDTERGCG